MQFPTVRKVEVLLKFHVIVERVIKCRFDRVANDYAFRALLKGNVGRSKR